MNRSVLCPSCNGYTIYSFSSNYHSKWLSAFAQQVVINFLIKDDITSSDILVGCVTHDNQIFPDSNSATKLKTMDEKPHNRCRNAANIW